MEKKTFRPKKGREGARISVSLPDRENELVIGSWPYETDDVGEQAALARHPWLTDRAEPKQSQRKEGEG